MVLLLCVRAQLPALLHIAIGQRRRFMRYLDLGQGQWDIPALRTLLEEILRDNASFDDFEVEHVFPQIGRKKMLLNARRLAFGDETEQMILLAIEDVTGAENLKT